MNIKIKNKSDFERVVHLTLVDDDFQEERKTSIANIGKELKIKGFRPGKVPPQIVEREVGDDYINQNAIELALPRLVFDFLKEKELQPAITPSIQKIENKKDQYLVEVIVTLWPKIKKLPKTDIEIVIDEIEPEDQAVKEQIENIRKQFAEVEKVERAADTGDFITMNLTARRGGEDLENLSVQDHLY